MDQDPEATDDARLPDRHGSRLLGVALVVGLVVLALVAAVVR